MISEETYNIITALRDELAEHNYNYYVLAKPIISDFDFDMKLKELEKLEVEFPKFADPNSPTQRVGSDISKDFEQSFVITTHNEDVASIGEKQYILDYGILSSRI